MERLLVRKKPLSLTVFVYPVKGAGRETDQAIIRIHDITEEGWTAGLKAGP